VFSVGTTSGAPSKNEAAAAVTEPSLATVQKYRRLW